MKQYAALIPKSVESYGYNSLSSALEHASHSPALDEYTVTCVIEVSADDDTLKDGKPVAFFWNGKKYTPAPDTP